MKDFKIRVTRPVYLYLVKNKIYKQFIYNCKKYRFICMQEGWLNILKFSKDRTTKAKFPSDAINFGFKWDRSKEGLEFWKKEYEKALEYENSKH